MSIASVGKCTCGTRFWCLCQTPGSEWCDVGVRMRRNAVISSDAEILLYVCLFVLFRAEPAKPISTDCRDTAASTSVVSIRLHCRSGHTTKLSKRYSREENTFADGD